MNVKKVISINIVDEILFRPDALDTYLGEDVRVYLMDKCAEITDATLVRIDLRKANPIDYLFTKVAFCDFFKLLNHAENVDGLFLIRKSQKRNFFWGLLAGMDGNIHRTGSYEEDFITTNYIKIAIEENQIEFIGNLNAHEQEILDFVNEMSTIEKNKIYEKFQDTIAHEKITDTIRSLNTRKFIYWDDLSQPSIVNSVESINKLV